MLSLSQGKSLSDHGACHAFEIMLVLDHRNVGLVDMSNFSLFCCTALCFFLTGVGWWQAFTAENVLKWYQESATQMPMPWVKDLAGTFKSAFPKEPTSYVAERGWQAETVQSYADLADQYAKGLPWTTNLGLGVGNAATDTNTAFIDAIVIPHQ